ncbi:MAG: hypothetical protein ACRC1D_09465 [Culicoidibacterales bacterium]
MQAETKVIQGLTLVFDDELQKYVYPLPPESGKRIMYDDATNQLLEIVIANGGMMYQERTVDGVTERVFVQANAPSLSVTPDMIQAEKLKLQKQFLDAANGIVPMLYIGFGISAIVFFYNLICNLDVFVKAIAEGSSSAISEVSYLLFWVAGIAFLAFFVFRGVPLLFSIRFRQNIDDDVLPTEPKQPGTESTTTNIYINNAKNVGGNVGNANAQDFIDNRNI